MKQVLIILVLALLMPACQKKKDSEETPGTTTGSTTSTTPMDDPVLTVTINDTLYTCPGIACASGYKSGGIRGLTLGDQSSKKHLFRFTFLKMPTPGVYSLGSGGDVSLQYVANNTYYNVVTGTLNISAVDTTDRGVIHRFLASFSAKTDTTLPAPYVIYRISEGTVKLK